MVAQVQHGDTSYCHTVAATQFVCSVGSLSTASLLLCMALAEGHTAAPAAPRTSPVPGATAHQQVQQHCTALCAGHQALAADILISHSQQPVLGCSLLTAGGCLCHQMLLMSIPGNHLLVR
eukprot:GHRR01001494.1.p1 GENE.GHRR01001494.1~~GHRR01001494.1.p1  ORF type:complete len:121 (+),score=33.41 GHRR01001494.1:704-1066(+)